MVSAVLLTTGTALSVFSTVPYIKDIIQGKTKPRMVSWAVWALLLGMTAIVSWQQHQISSAVLSGASTIGCLVVTVLAVRYASLRLTRMELYSLFGALVGLVLWLVLDDPMLVLIAALVVDGIAYLPTYVNGWRNPRDESRSAFMMSACGSGMVLLAAVLAHAAPIGLIYPLYSTVFGGIMIGILLMRRQYGRKVASDDYMPDELSLASAPEML